MISKARKIFAIAVLAMVASVAFAQQLKVATGDAKSGSTYSVMFNQLKEECSAEGLPLVEQTTSGSVENMDLLLGNQVNAAIMQTDIMWLKSRTQDLGSLKTLFTMHPEEVHFLALNVAQKTGALDKVKGLFGSSSNNAPMQEIGQLANRRVGAAGGSILTANVIKLQTDIPYQIQEYPSTAAAIEGLNKGEIDAVIAVGGAPLGSMKDLDRNYRLLEVPESVVGKLKNVYVPARISYSKMGASGVSTVATDAIFVTRDYKTAKYVEGLSKLRACLFKNIDDLKESTGMHPKWNDVHIENKGKWTWYELPQAQAVKVKR